MNKKKLFDLLYVVMIIALIVFLIWIVKFMKSEAKDCMKDPIDYFETKNEGSVCNCWKEGVSYKDQGIASTNNFNFHLPTNQTLSSHQD